MGERKYDIELFRYDDIELFRYDVFCEITRIQLPFTIVDIMILRGMHTWHFFFNFLEYDVP